MQNERTRDGKYAQHKGPHKTPNRRQFKTKQNQKNGIDDCGTHGTASSLGCESARPPRIGYRPINEAALGGSLLKATKGNGRGDSPHDGHNVVRETWRKPSVFAASFKKRKKLARIDITGGLDIILF